MRFILQHEKDFKYNSDFYGFEVKTRQERGIKFYHIKDVNPTQNDSFEILHEETIMDLEEEKRLIEEESEKQEKLSA